MSRQGQLLVVEVVEGERADGGQLLGPGAVDQPQRLSSGRRAAFARDEGLVELVATSMTMRARRAESRAMTVRQVCSVG